MVAHATSHAAPACTERLAIRSSRFRARVGFEHAEPGIDRSLSVAKGRNEAFGVAPISTDSDRGGQPWPTVREALVRMLSEAVRDAMSSGDMVVGRIALEALNRVVEVMR